MIALLDSAEATESFGALLARSCPPAPEPGLLIFLSGELGAGKTTFARGFLRQLGVPGVVRSPTYTLIEPYETTRGTVLHADFYRLASGDDAAERELREQLGPGCICLLEWPERVAALLRAPDLHVELALLASGRRACCHGDTSAGEGWLSAAAMNGQQKEPVSL